MTHPIRQAELHTFQRTNGNGKGSEWAAQFYPYRTYPVLFSGQTEAEVIAKAEDLRTDAIDKHEAACIRRQEAKAKAAARRKSKELA